MKKHTEPRCLARYRNLTLAALIVSFTAPAFAEHCEDIGYRIWRPGGEQTRYDQGELIRLEPGVEAHLYIHHASQARNPYSTSAIIGYPQAVGLRAPFDRDVVDLRAQDDKDRREGRLILDTRKPGETTIGYQIEAVSKAGLFEALDPACRRGTVRIEVLGRRGNDRHGDHDGDGPTAAQAARELGHALERALMPWQKATIDDRELERIVAGGREGLVRHAVAILRSPSFKDDSYYHAIESDETLSAELERYGDVEPERVVDAVLESLYNDLYGDSRPATRLHRANHEDLFDCVTGDERARGFGCEQLAERLLSFPAYTQRHREALDALAAGHGR